VLDSKFALLNHALRIARSLAQKICEQALFHFFYSFCWFYTAVKKGLG